MSFHDDTSYFPPLDRCLSGGHLLISWRDAARALSLHASGEDHTWLDTFLSSNEALKILAASPNPFPDAPTSASKSVFETKTAPSQVSPSIDGSYSIDQIKADALWLSGQLQIEELVALRVVVLEWQHRDVELFLSVEQNTFPTERESSNIALGVSMRTSNHINTLGSRPVIFNDEDQRRHRILKTHLLEIDAILEIFANLATLRTQRVLSVKELALTNASDDWLFRLAEEVARQQYDGDETKCQRICRDRYIAFLRTTYEQERKGTIPEIFKTSQVQDLHGRLQLQKVVHILRTMLALAASIPRLLDSALVGAWYELMDDLVFLQNEYSSIPTLDVAELNCLVALFSLSCLQLQQTVSRLSEAAQSPDGEHGLYPNVQGTTLELYKDERVLSAVNLTLYRAASSNIGVAAPAIYAWSVITANLQTLAVMEARYHDESGRSTSPITSRLGRSSEHNRHVWESRFEKLQDLQLEDARPDPPRFFADTATSVMKVYPLIGALAAQSSSSWHSTLTSGTDGISRILLFDLIREGMTWVAYGEELLETIFGVLEIGTTDNRPSHITHRLAARFWEDGAVLRPMVLEQAFLRYPFELSPLLRLLTALAGGFSRGVSGLDAMLDSLEQLDTFTVIVPANFRAYRLESEDEGSNDMVLQEPLAIFENATYARYHVNHGGSTALTRSSSDPSRTIPAGASGNIIRENAPKIIKLNHKHSLLSYLGLLLSTLRPGSELETTISAPDFDRTVGAEILQLVNVMMAPSQVNSTWKDTARLVLYQCSAATDDEQDVVSIVAEVLEAELTAHVEQTVHDGSLPLITACIEFLCIIALCSPERVWFILSQSCLLGISSGSNAVGIIVTNHEVPTGRFRFLSAIARLFALLLDDSIAGCIVRCAQTSATRGNRFDSPFEQAENPSTRVVRATVTAYTRIALDAFQNLPNWRFCDYREQVEITTTLLSSFKTALLLSYGLDIHAKASVMAANLIDIMGAAAELVLQSFRVDSSTNVHITGLVQAFETVASSLESPTISKEVTTTLMVAASGFMKTLLHTIKFGFPDQVKSVCNELSRSCTATLIKLFVLDPALKAEVSELLAELIDTASEIGEDSSSILASINQETVAPLLRTFTQLDRPLVDSEAEVKIWRFLSSALDGHQQYLAIYLLTGHLPREHRTKERSQSNAPTTSLLNYALQQLATITDLAPSRAKTMLQFVKRAQSVWAWSSTHIQAQTTFIDNAIKWLNDLRPISRSTDTSQSLLVSTEYEIAALLCEILATNVHAGLELGNKDILRKIREQLHFSGQHVIEDSSYNRSLHSNLADNLQAKYPGCKLSDFKRTVANPALIGDDFVYDVELANKLLSHDPAWKGSSNGRGRRQGFEEEFRRANANLSLVTAQGQLLKGWQALATSLCRGLEQEPMLQTTLAQAAEDCLKVSAYIDVDEPGAVEALQTRAELAFMLLSALVSHKSSNKTMTGLLVLVWELVRSSPIDFGVATAHEDLVYYRLVLQLLYLAIQPHIYGAGTRSGQQTDPAKAFDGADVQLLSPEIGLCLVDVVRKAVAPGFKALCGNIHNNAQLALPADFALLNGLLQAVISVRGIESVYIQFADVVADSGIVRGALSLFSWSDRLAEYTHHDPVYGEVAVTLLSTLSAVRLVAEQMALDGALLQLSNANLADYFRKPNGKTPFSEPTRMFSIWTEGFLPICLNLLDAVGPPMTAQVAIFLNSFPQQLGRAESALQPQNTVAQQSPHQGDVTLSLAAEAHSLLMISLVLEADVARAAAEGINAADVPRLSLNSGRIKDGVTTLLRNKRGLSDHVVPTNEREAAFALTPGVDASYSVLAERVLYELECAAACFESSDKP